jgi:hypothetical protein
MIKIAIMKYKTTVKPGKNLIKVWKKTANDIVSKLQRQELFVNLGNTSTALMESECIRAVYETIPESAERNLLLKCMLDAENASAGGSYALLLHLSGIIDDFEITGLRFSLNDLQLTLSNFVGKLASNIVSDAIKIAGRNGKIFLDSSEPQASEISFGTQNCKWAPPELFFTTIKLPKASVQNCRVAFIDGIIESVSECHKIFQWSYDAKTPVVIFARGFAEEVIATAGVNLQRQTAQVIPILISFDEVGVNSFGDIASCFGSDVISADKGQLVSSLDLEQCVKVNRITVTSKSSEIEFHDNLVDSVVERLSKKLSISDAGQSDLIKKRIDALGTGSVTIKIGTDQKNLLGIQKDRVDFGIRFVKSCLSHGIIVINGKMMPSTAVKNGIKCSKSFMGILSNCGATLEIEKCG